ncbi:MAG: hypothetical protein HOV92_36910, partial [Streptomyces sp.]|nr:hypothetical protein [Streptomyces sp.]
MSATRPAGAPAANSANRPATSPTSIGWSDTPAGNSITGTLDTALKNLTSRSWNCVVR